MLGQPGLQNHRHADYCGPDPNKESAQKRVVGKEQGGPEGSQWGPCPATYRRDLPPAPSSHESHHGFSETRWDCVAASVCWDCTIASGCHGFCSLGHNSSSASWDCTTASSCRFCPLRPHHHGFCLLQQQHSFCWGPAGSAISASVEVRMLAVSLAIG
ncbi:hypothetical protein P7K49_037107 [Saguinus oedipus]|uniref:Uncharacterized protein n=1 Tax=Saguinus oedipus TaxID=9490 RepID=A0ABQ9TH70_SAGOE|nr:hypothetical protein P7K49_037107 [Saguinus oedipus]